MSSNDTTTNDIGLNQLLGDAAARPWWRRPAPWIGLVVLAAAALAPTRSVQPTHRIPRSMPK